MPRVMRDYICHHCGNAEERITLMEQVDTTVQCSKCSNPLTVQLSASRFKLDPISGDFPSASRNFDLVHRQATKVENNRSYYDPT